MYVKVTIEGVFIVVYCMASTDATMVCSDTIFPRGKKRTKPIKLDHNHRNYSGEKNFVRGDVRVLLRLLEAEEVFSRSNGEPNALVLPLDEDGFLYSGRGGLWLLEVEEFFCSPGELHALVGFLTLHFFLGVR